MICVTCYVTSQGAEMQEAAAVIKGESVCSKHLEERARVAEKVNEDRPTVEPH